MELTKRVCKVVLIGDSGVGKTSIISQFAAQNFDENSMTTAGATARNKVVFFEDINTYIDFVLWDTAGQERYRSLSSMFFKDADIAILVYSIIELKTFDSIKTYWYGQAKDHGRPELVIGVAGNKSDLYETEKVSEETGRIFASSINAPFQLVSAKFNEGVNELFTELAKRFLFPNGVNNKSYHMIKKNQLDSTQNITLTSNMSNSQKNKCCK